MSFGHKKLDVYRLSLEYVRWVYSRIDGMSGIHRHARDQLLRASQSIPLNVAEGNGKFTAPDRGRYFGIARGSALECAAIQDVLLIAGVLSQAEYDEAEALLVRIVSMLTKLGQRSGSIREDGREYRAGEFDHDHDHDHSLDKDSERAAGKTVSGGGG